VVTLLPPLPSHGEASPHHAAPPGQLAAQPTKTAGDVAAGAAAEGGGEGGVRLVHVSPQLVVAWKPTRMRASGSHAGTLQSCLAALLPPSSPRGGDGAVDGAGGAGCDEDGQVPTPAPGTSGSSAAQLTKSAVAAQLTQPAVDPQQLVVSRLDSGCAGLCLVARSGEALRRLQGAEITHTFVALVYGEAPAAWGRAGEGAMTSGVTATAVSPTQEALGERGALGEEAMGEKGALGQLLALPPEHASTARSQRQRRNAKAAYRARRAAAASVAEQASPQQATGANPSIGARTADGQEAPEPDSAGALDHPADHHPNAGAEAAAAAAATQYVAGRGAVDHVRVCCQCVGSLGDSGKAGQVAALSTCTLRSSS
jgi:hypothetical protein